MLDFGVEEGGVHPKKILKEVYYLQIPIFKTFKLTPNFKTTHKICLK